MTEAGLIKIIDALLVGSTIGMNISAQLEKFKRLVAQGKTDQEIAEIFEQDLEATEIEAQAKIDKARLAGR
jgi:fatty acid-binding protein DegV